MLGIRAQTKWFQLLSDGNMEKTLIANLPLLLVVAEIGFDLDLQKE